MWVAIVAVVAIFGVSAFSFSHHDAAMAKKNKALQEQVSQLKKHQVKQVKKLDGVEITNLDK